MEILDVIPVGPVEEAAIGAMEACASERLGLRVRRRAPLEEPHYAWDPARSQHESSAILERLLAARSPGAARTLGVTEADLFIPMLTFVFGQAQLGGSLALVSLARLRQEFYGFPPDPELLQERAAKECLHELGHTLGLVHCADPSCAASLSTHIQHVDCKNVNFCPACSRLLLDTLAALAVAGSGHAGLEARP